MKRGGRRGQIEGPNHFLPLAEITMFMSLLGALAVAVATPAEDPKPATAAEIRKQIADLEAVAKKKTAELAKAKDAAKAIDDERKKVAEKELEKLKTLFDASEKVLAPLKEKAVAEKETAIKLRKVAEEAGRAAEVASAKLKAATDPKEVEELKKKAKELETALKAKVDELKKAETVAKGAEATYLKGVEDARADLDRAKRAADDAVKTVQVKAADALKTLNRLQDELDLSAVTIRRLKDKLAELEK